MSTRTNGPSSESDLSLLLGGLTVVFFGLMATGLAIGAGWLPAAFLGVVMLLLAGKVPTPSRVLPTIVAGFGLVALLCAAYRLLF